MFNNDMKTEAIPERVFALCKVLIDGKMAEKDIRKMFQPEESSYFGIVRDAAKQLGLIVQDEDSKVIELSIDHKELIDYVSFRRYINKNLEKISDGQFYRTVQLFMINSKELFEIDKDLQSVSKIVGILNDYDKSLGIDEENMRAWRFWASYLGFGYLHNMFFMPNACVFVKDCIFNSKIIKNKTYSMDDFIGLLYPYIQICLSNEERNNRKLNFALSNAFRSLHDLGIIELKTVNDREDEWILIDMPLHPVPSIITDVTYKGEE